MGVPIRRVASTGRQAFPTLQMSQEQCGLASLALYLLDGLDTANLIVWSQNHSETHSFWFAEQICVCLQDTTIIAFNSFCLYDNFPPLPCHTAGWKSINWASISCWEMATFKIPFLILLELKIFFLSKRKLPFSVKNFQRLFFSQQL